MAETATKKNRTRYIDVASIVVREWAQKNGHPQIGDRGRLSTTVVKEFNDAHKAEKLRYSGPNGVIPEGWVSTGATSHKAAPAEKAKATTKAAPAQKVTATVPKASTKAAVREQVTTTGNVPASFADIMELFSKQANTPGTVTIMTAALPVSA